VAITSVGQGYKSIEGCHDYKTNTGITYSGQEQPMKTSKMETQVLQLQQVQTHGKRMLIKEERMQY